MCQQRWPPKPLGPSRSSASFFISYSNAITYPGCRFIYWSILSQICTTAGFEQFWCKVLGYLFCHVHSEWYSTAGVHRQWWSVLLSPKLTWLFASLSQSPSSDLIRHKVESMAGYVPQGEGQPSSVQTPGSLLPQDDTNTVNGSTVSLSCCLTLQTHLHQVNGCTYKHLKADQVKGAVHPK